MNYKKIFTTFSILFLGGIFVTPVLASATLKEQERAGAKQLQQSLSNASNEENKVIKRVKKDKNNKIVEFEKCGNGSTDGTILVYVDKQDWEKTKK
ncbi:MAG: hypothetical protein LBL38_01790 [Lactobacillales bacterium]|jgi:hypothetical protein|nr:hypothetical protein [Lactobacillales bacterium]